jgi:hypothetical protein
LKQQLRLLVVFQALMGIWAVLGPIEIIPVSQAEPVQSSETTTSEYQYATAVACSLLDDLGDDAIRTQGGAAAAASASTPPRQANRGVQRMAVWCAPRKSGDR